jgi:hypothetical protein
MGPNVETPPPVARQGGVSPELVFVAYGGIAQRIS